MSKPVGDSLIAELTKWVIDQVGHCYALGGAPGVDGRGCWDCSSFCNFAWGRVGEQSIPGYPNGSYDGTTHGPSTLGWLGWQGQGVGSIDRSEVKAGDLMCWQTHMGFAISNTQMVSAQTPSSGTQVGTIDGFMPGETLVPLRLAVVGPGGITLPIPTIGNTMQIDRITRDVAKATRSMVDIGTRIRTMRVGTR